MNFITLFVGFILLWSGIVCEKSPLGMASTKNYSVVSFYCDRWHILFWSIDYSRHSLNQMKCVQPNGAMEKEGKKKHRNQSVINKIGAWVSVEGKHIASNIKCVTNIFSWQNIMRSAVTFLHLSYSFCVITLHFRMQTNIYLPFSSHSLMFGVPLWVNEYNRKQLLLTAGWLFLISTLHWFSTKTLFL